MLSFPQCSSCKTYDKVFTCQYCGVFTCLDCVQEVVTFDEYISCKHNLYKPIIGDNWNYDNYDTKRNSK